MGIGDIIGNSVGSMSNGTGNILFYINMIAWPVIIIGVGWLVLRFLSYSVRVHVHNPTDKGVLKEYDSGRFLRNKKTEYREFILLKNKKDWRGGMIPMRFFVPTKKIFSRIGWEIYMIRDSEGRLQPILPPDRTDLTEWTGMSSNDLSWGLNEYEESVRAVEEKGKWADLIPVMVPMAGFIIMFVLVLVLFKEMSGVQQGLQSVASQLGSVVAQQQVIN